MADEDVEVKFGASIEGLVGSMTQVREVLQGLTEPIKGIREGLGELAEAFIAAFAVEKISEFARQMGELGDKTEDLAAILGVPTEEIGRLGLMAQASGGTIEELQGSFGRLSRAITEQSDQTKRALQALGLSFADLQGKDAEAQLEVLADAFSRVKDGSDKAAIAIALLGRSGTEMIPILNEGSAGIKEWAEEADRLGATLSSQTTAGLVQTQRAFVEMDAAVQGSGVATFMEFKGAIDGVVAATIDLAAAFNAAMKSGGMMKDVMDMLGAAFNLVIEVVVDLIAILREIWVVGVFAIDMVALALKGMAMVAMGVGEDIATNLVQPFRAVYEIAAATIGGIGQFFVGLIRVAVGAAEDIDAVFGHAFSHLFQMGAEAVNAVGGLLAKLGADMSATTGDFSFGDNAKKAFAEMEASAEEAGKRVTASLASVRDFAWGDNAQKAFDQSNKELTDRTSQFKDDEVSIYRDLSSEWSKIWGDGSKNVEEQNDQHNARMNAADRGAAKERADASLAELNGEIQALQAGLRQKEQVIDGEFKLHQITEQQKVAATRQAVDEEYEAELGLLQKEAQIGGLKLAQHQEILNRINQLEIQHNTEVLKLEQESAQATMQSWTSALNTISGAFNSQLSGILAGTTSWRTAMANIFKDLAMKAIEWVEQMVIKWVAGEAGKTAATTAGVAARTTAEQAGSLSGLAANFATMVKSVLASAAQTFAGIFGFLSPVMGPAAVGPAAAGEATVAAAASAIPSLAVGTWGLPSDSVIQAHQGETIIPAFESGQFRAAIDKINQAPSAASGGGGESNHFHFHGAILDGNKLMKFVNDLVSKNPSMRPNYGRG